jgi:hypothetical protein
MLNLPNIHTLFITKEIIMKIFSCIFNAIGNFINQLPTKEEEKKIKHSPLHREHIWQTVKQYSYAKSKVPKPIKRAKGSPNTDAQIFNHPRH